MVGELVVSYDKAVVASSLDKLKALGFEWSTRAGLTISIADVTTPPQKAGLLTTANREWLQGLALPDAAREQVTVALAMIDALDDMPAGLNVQSYLRSVG